DFQRRVQRLEGLTDDFERCPDPAVRARARELVQTILELHRVGLARIFAHLAGAGEPGRALVDMLARDELVASLLLLYGLHPLDFEARVVQTLEKVRPSL